MSGDIEEIRSRIKYYNKSDQVILNVLITEIDNLKREVEKSYQKGFNDGSHDKWRQIFDPLYGQD